MQYSGHIHRTITVYISTRCEKIVFTDTVNFSILNLEEALDDRHNTKFTPVLADSQPCVRISMSLYK